MDMHGFEYMVLVHALGFSVRFLVHGRGGVYTLYTHVYLYTEYSVTAAIYLLYTCLTPTKWWNNESPLYSSIQQEWFMVASAAVVIRPTAHRRAAVSAMSWPAFVMPPPSSTERTRAWTTPLAYRSRSLIDERVRARRLGVRSSAHNLKALKRARRRAIKRVVVESHSPSV